jgi:hypothetical protein
MPVPPLREAINQNSLAVFLLVCFVSPPTLLDRKLIYVHIGIVCGTAGERGDERGEPVNGARCMPRTCVQCVSALVHHVASTTFP